MNGRRLRRPYKEQNKGLRKRHPTPHPPPPSPLAQTKASAPASSRPARSSSSLRVAVSEGTGPADANLEEAIEEPGHTNQQDDHPKPSYQDQEEVIKKKYGGMLPKKVPLISKDHERAFFDSADWALGKQGAPVGKPKGPLEALRPKLQPTPHQQVRSRRSAYARPDGEEGGNAASDEMAAAEDMNSDD